MADPKQPGKKSGDELLSQVEKAAMNLAGQPNPTGHQAKAEEDTPTPEELQAEQDAASALEDAKTDHQEALLRETQLQEGKPTIVNAQEPDAATLAANLDGLADPSSIGDIQKEQEKLREDAKYGRGGYAQGARTIEQVKADEESTSQNLRARAGVYGAIATTMETLNKIQEQQFVEMQELRESSQALFSQAELAGESLQDMSLQASQSYMDLDALREDISITSDDSIDNFFDGMSHNMDAALSVSATDHLKNSIDNFTAEHSANLEGLEQRRASSLAEISNKQNEISKLGDSNPEKAAELQQELQDLKQNLEDVGTEISDLKTQQDHMTKVASAAEGLCNDKTMSTEAKTSALNALSSSVNATSDNKITQGEWSVIKSNLVDLDANDAQSQKVIDVITNSGIKVETPEGQLSGEAAAAYLAKDYNSARTNDDIQKIINEPAPEALKFAPEAEPKSPIEAALDKEAVDPYDPASYNFSEKPKSALENAAGDALFSSGDKDEGLAGTTLERGTHEDAVMEAEKLVDGGKVSEEDLKAVTANAPADVRQKVEAALDNKNIEVVKSDGAEATNNDVRGSTPVMDGPVGSALAASNPMLFSGMGRSPVAEPTEPDNYVSKSSEPYVSVMDDPAYAKYNDPEATYMAPINNGAAAAPAASNNFGDAIAGKDTDAPKPDEPVAVALQAPPPPQMGDDPNDPLSPTGASPA